jgi:hypothetical protein
MKSIEQKYLDELTKDWSEGEKVLLMWAQIITTAFPTVSDFMSIQPMQETADAPVFYMDFKYTK